MRGGSNPAAILDALGDPTRRVIFERLSRAPTDATTLAASLPVSRSAVARHLGVLRAAGLVACARDGQRQVYRLAGDGLDPLVAWISDRSATRAAPLPPRRTPPTPSTRVPRPR